MFKLTIAFVTAACALRAAIATPLYETPSGLALRDMATPAAANMKLDNTALEAEDDGILDTIGSLLGGFGLRDLDSGASTLENNAAESEEAGILDTLGSVLGSFGFRDVEGEDSQLKDNAVEAPDDGILDTLGGLLGSFGFRDIESE